MSNPTQHPHVYKKGKILNLKQLDAGASGSKERKYIFFTGSSNIAQIIGSCNNINQITGRNWLHLSKLLSYFGLSKDPSEKLSKNGTPSNFNKFFLDFKKGDDTRNTTNNLKEIKNLLEKQEKILEILSKKLTEIEEKLQPKSEGEKEVLQKLDKIHEGLKQVLGV